MWFAKKDKVDSLEKRIKKLEDAVKKLEAIPKYSVGDELDGCKIIEVKKITSSLNNFLLKKPCIIKYKVYDAEKNELRLIDESNIK